MLLHLDNTTDSLTDAFMATRENYKKLYGDENYVLRRFVRAWLQALAGGFNDE